MSEELTAELEAILARGTSIDLWGNCQCDGYSIGHEPDCNRSIVGSRIELLPDDCRRVAELLPSIVGALNTREDSEAGGNLKRFVAGLAGMTLTPRFGQNADAWRAQRMREIRNAARLVSGETDV